MTAQCEATTLKKRWTRARCKRNATVTVCGHKYCEQHAKIMVGMQADVHLSAVDAL